MIKGLGVCCEMAGDQGNDGMILMNRLFGPLNLAT